MNLFALTSADPTQPAFPPSIGGYSEGRFSNGDIWVEVLAQRLGIPSPTASLTGGTNYAWGGAETSTSGLSFRGTPNIGAQINGFPGIPGVFPPVPGYLSGNTPTANQLFLIWGGGNDFNNSPTLPNSNDAVDFAGNIAANIRTLVNAGATNFMVPNLPRLGQIPRHMGGPNENLFDQLTIEFNAALAAELDAIEANSNVSIYRVDTHRSRVESLSGFFSGR